MRMWSNFDQTSQQLEIFFVFFQIWSLRRFQAHGQAPKALVVQEQTKRFDADKSFADMLVAVDSGVDTPSGCDQSSLSKKWISGKLV